MLKPLLPVILVFVALCQTNTTAECIAKPRKPVEVSGALCGKVFDTVANLEPNTELLLFNQNNENVANVRSGTKGEFNFPALPAGRYRLAAKKWVITWGEIVLTSPNGASCKKPVSVYVGLAYPDCAGGWVSNKWDFHRFPDGPSRKPHGSSVP